MEKEIKRIFDNNPTLEKLYSNEKQELFTSLNDCENSKKGKCKVLERSGYQSKKKNNKEGLGTILEETEKDKENG